MGIYINNVPNPGAEGATLSIENHLSTTVTRTTETHAKWPTGTYSYKILSNVGTITGARLRLVDRPAATPGQRWHVRLRARVADTLSGAVDVRVRLRFYDAPPGATQGNTVTDFTELVNQTPGWTQTFTVSGIAPASTQSVGVVIERNSGTTGDYIQVDDILLTQWDAVETPPYADGDSPYGVWTGTAYASPSTVYVPAFEVNPFLNDTPCPRVEVVVSDLPPAVATATLYRLAEGRTYPVRNGINVQAVGGFARLDHEVPFGVPTSYSVEAFDGDGDAYGFSTASEPFTINVPDTWFHNPLDPSGAVKADLRGDALRDLSRPAQASVFYPQGRSAGIIVSGGRRALTGVNISAVTDTLEQADRMQALLGDGTNMSVPVICLRIGANDRARIPHTLFLAILDQREQDIDYVYGGETIAWDMTGDEVQPPVPALVTASYTLADLDASYTSLAAIDAAYLTLLDIDRDYGLAGAA